MGRDGTTFCRQNASSFVPRGLRHCLGSGLLIAHGPDAFKAVAGQLLSFQLHRDAAELARRVDVVARAEQKEHLAAIQQHGLHVANVAALRNRVDETGRLVTTRPAFRSALHDPNLLVAQLDFILGAISTRGQRCQWWWWWWGGGDKH